MKFEGIYPPAVTPYADGSIDKKAFAGVPEFLVEAKVHGILTGGLISEYSGADEASTALEITGTVLPFRLRPMLQHSEIGIGITAHPDVWKGRLL